MSDFNRLRDLLDKRPAIQQTQPSTTKPSTFTVDYYATTPNGARSRFQRSSTLWHVRDAASETAILAYLKTLHPTCEITIQNLKFN